MSVPTARRILVVETRSRWAPAVRGVLRMQVERIVECRSLEECATRLADWPEAVAAIDLASCQADLSARLLRELQQRFSRALWVALGTHDVLLAAELGCSAAFGQLHLLAELAPMVARHFAGLPRRPLSLRDEIWERIPWTAAATIPAGRRRRRAAETPAVEMPVEFEPSPDEELAPELPIDFEPLDEP